MPLMATPWSAVAVLLFARPALIDVPFFVARLLKIAYDPTLYWSFVAVQPPEEMPSDRVLR